jgi:hypothetical protein
VKTFADRAALRPWSVLLGLIGTLLVAWAGWWLVANYHPNVRGDPGPSFIGLPAEWVATAVLGLGSLCLGLAYRRLRAAGQGLSS